MHHKQQLVTSLMKPSSKNDYQSYTNANEDCTEFPSAISKYYLLDKGNIDDHDEEEVLRDIMMLDMVVHIEDVQSQLVEILDMYKSFATLIEIWRENSTYYIDDHYRVKWIVDETKKRQKMHKMSSAFHQLQEEIALLSIKSKDLYRDHRQHLEVKRRTKQDVLSLKSRILHECQNRDEVHLFGKPQTDDVATLGATDLVGEYCHHLELERRSKDTGEMRRQSERRSRNRKRLHRHHRSPKQLAEQRQHANGTTVATATATADRRGDRSVSTSTTACISSIGKSSSTGRLPHRSYKHRSKHGLRYHGIFDDWIHTRHHRSCHDAGS